MYGRRCWWRAGARCSCRRSCSRGTAQPPCGGDGSAQHRPNKSHEERNSRAAAMPGRSRGAKDAAADISRWAVGLAHLQCAVSAARADGGTAGRILRRMGTGLNPHGSCLGGRWAERNEKFAIAEAKAKSNSEHRHMRGRFANWRPLELLLFSSAPHRAPIFSFRTLHPPSCPHHHVCHVHR